MDDTKYFSAREILTLLDAPTNLAYPRAGGTRVEKAGVSGAGSTPLDAAADWCRKFAAMVTLPRDAPENDDGDTGEEDTDLAPQETGEGGGNAGG